MMIIHNPWKFSKNSDDYLYVSGNFYDEDYDDEYDYDDNYIDGVYGSKKEFSSGLSDNNKVSTQTWWLDSIVMEPTPQT